MASAKLGCPWRRTLAWAALAAQLACSMALLVPRLVVPGGQRVAP